MNRAKKIAVVVVALLGAGGGAVAVRARRSAHDHAHDHGVAARHDKREGPLRLAAIAAMSSRALAGDPRLGAELYATHCVSCHGFSGRGDGPATSWLHPLARDHTSPYMATRTDEQLAKEIDEGGRPNDLSSLMPSFSDRFDDTETWALVAYLRTLHPDVASMVPAGARLELEPIVVSPDRMSRVAAKSGVSVGQDELRVDVIRAYAPGASPEKTLGYVAVERVPGAPSDLWVAVTTDGTAFRRSVLPESDVIAGRGQVVHGVFGLSLALDTSGLAATPLPSDVAALASNVRVTAAKLETRLHAALEQREVEIAASQEIYARFQKTPDAFSHAQQLYMKDCATCHGATGQAIGANTTAHPSVRPKNLADGSYMNPLPDEHLAFMIRYGGGPARHSGNMPGFGSASLSPDEIQELVRYIRTLAVPASDGKGGAAHGHH